MQDMTTGKAWRKRNMWTKVARKVTDMPECNMVGGLGWIPVWVMKREVVEGGARAWNVR